MPNKKRCKRKLQRKLNGLKHPFEVPLPMMPDITNKTGTDVEKKKQVPMTIIACKEPKAYAPLTATRACIRAFAAYERSRSASASASTSSSSRFSHLNEYVTVHRRAATAGGQGRGKEAGRADHEHREERLFQLCCPEGDA